MTSASYPLSGLSTNTPYYWKVVAKNNCGQSTTGPVWSFTTLCISPSITSQPQSQTIQSGQTAALSVTATGTTPLSYQWYRGSSGDTSNPISGGTSSNYTTPALTQTASYWVRVSNACGSQDSNTATITVTCIVTVLIGGDPSGGSVTPSSRTVNHGSAATFTVTTNTGYTASVSEGTLTGTTWTIPNVTSTHTATVTFTINSYTVTASVGGDPLGGSVTPSSRVVNHGSSATFTVTTNVGYTASASEGTLTGTTWTIPNVTSTHTATVTFALNTYPITATAGSGGAVIPGSTAVNHGSSQSFTISPNTGYHIQNVIVDGTSQGAIASYTFTNVTASHTIEATFLLNTYTVTASVVGDPSGGSVTPSSRVVDYGSSASFTVTTNVGYTASVSEGTLTGTTWTIPNVTSTRTATVTFTINTYTINFPQTGQTICYDANGNSIECTGTGQDGEIQAGVGWQNPKFLDNSDATMTDTLTGLIWASDGSGPSFGTCTGGDYKYWDEAINYIDCLNNNFYLGHNDWRLPNLNELESLINLAAGNPSEWLKAQGFKVIGWKYWTSTTYAEHNEYAWYIYIDTGMVDWMYKGWAGRAWPVRGGQQNEPDDTYAANIWKTGLTQSYYAHDDGDYRKGVLWPNPRFSEPETAIVKDNLTSIMWTKDANAPGPSECNPDTTKSWQSALDYIVCLNTNNYLGYNDWRLPNRKELWSILDRSQFNPAIPANSPFINMTADKYWVSSYIGNLTSSAWAINIFDGKLEDSNKNNSHYVWPIRGGVFTVIATSLEGNGTVSPERQFIASNDSTTITITPSVGYHISEINDNGHEAPISEQYTINNVTTSHDVVVTFALNTYTITVTAGSGGSITPSGVVIVTHGANQTFSITLDTGYHIADVLVDGVSVGAVTSYPFNNVTANHTISATFTLNTYTVTASIGGDLSGGSVTPSSRDVNHGASATFTVTTNTGYTASVSEGTLTGTTWTIPNVTSTHTATVTFTINTYTVTASVGGDPLGGSVTPSSRVVNHGASATFTVTTNTGYTASVSEGTLEGRRGRYRM